ncbi:MAG: WD40 repeat domain-containing protein, partial [Pirellulaceae bacterium]
ATAIALAVLSLVAATALSTYFAISEANQRRRSDRQAHRANLLAASAAIEDSDPIMAREVLEAATPAQRHTWEWRYLAAQLDGCDRLLRHHAGPVRALDFSPDGTRFVSGSADQTLLLWNLDDLDHPQVLTGHTGPVVSVRFDPRGNRILSSALDGTIRCWNATTGAQERVIPLTAGRSSPLDVSPDGSLLAAFTASVGREDESAQIGSMIRVWDIESGSLLSERTGPRGAGRKSLAFNNAGDAFLISAGSALIAEDVLTGRELMRIKSPHYFSANSITAIPHGNRFATAGRDKLLMIWDAAGLNLIHMLVGHGGPVLGARFTPDGSRLASASSDQTIRMWDAESGAFLYSCLGHVGEVSAVAISPDAKWLASGSEDMSIRLWRLDRSDLGERARFVPGDFGTVYDLAFHPQSDLLAVCSWRGKSRLVRASTGETVAVFDDVSQYLFRVAFSPDGRTVAFGGAGEVLLYDVESGIRTRIGGFKRRTKSIAFSKDSRRLYLTGPTAETMKPGMTSEVAVLDLAKGELVEFSRRDGTSYVVPSIRGNRLAIIQPEATQMRDLATDRHLFDFSTESSMIERLNFSPDGRRFVAALQNGTVLVCDGQTGTQLAVLRGHTDRVYDARFSPDGARIVSGSNDNTVRVWDATTYTQLLQLDGHQDYVHAAAFSPDGTMLASGSSDGTIRIWDALPRHERIGDAPEAAP